MAEPIKDEVKRTELALVAPIEVDPLRTQGAELARNLPWQANTPASPVFGERVKMLREAFKPVFAALDVADPKTCTDDVRWLRDHMRLIHGDLRGLADATKILRRIPHARDPKGAIVPRVVALAEGYFQASGRKFDDVGLTHFLEGFQELVVLDLHELWALVPALKLALLEQIAARAKELGSGRTPDAPGAGTCVQSLAAISHLRWRDVLEPLIVFDGILEKDPVGAYALMDFESRDFYRTQLAKVAALSLIHI